jgi:hypothetical protein
MKDEKKFVRDFDSGPSQSLLRIFLNGIVAIVEILRSFAMPHCRTLESSPSGLQISVSDADDLATNLSERVNTTSSAKQNIGTVLARRSFLGWFTALLIATSSRTSSGVQSLSFCAPARTDFEAELPNTITDLKSDATFLVRNRSKIEDACIAIRFSGPTPTDPLTAAIARVLCRKDMESGGVYVAQLQAAMEAQGALVRLVALCSQKDGLMAEATLTETLRAFEIMVDIELLETVKSLILPLELASLFRQWR